MPSRAPRGEIVDPLGGSSHRPTTAIILSIIAVLAVGLGGLAWYFWRPTLAPEDAGRGAVGNTSPAVAVPNTAAFVENGRTFREYGRQFTTVGIGLGDSYASVSGQLAYLARDGQTMVAVFRDEIWRSEDADVGDVVQIADVGGSPALVALKPSLSALGGFGSVIFHRGERFGDQYAFARSPLEVQGKLAFVGVDPGKDPSGADRTAVWHNGSEFAAATGGALFPFLYDGKLAAAIVDGGSVRVTVVEADGKETGLPAVQVDATAVKYPDGRVAYVLPTGDHRDAAVVGGKLAMLPLPVNGKSVVDYDGQTLGGEYDDVLEIAAVGGKLALLAMKAGTSVVVLDGQEYGQRYDLREAAGARQGAEKFFALSQVGEVGGKLTYVAVVGFSPDGEPKRVVVLEE
ncbi:MAG: hypothetical protein G01um101431_1022 [Parcubacteria group bacterium Gr01-1014_31]|nr:MAG: hypothetical protein G01um101431_1022 [Parcubacteria group bacterium Gr01-1014_31]